MKTRQILSLIIAAILAFGGGAFVGYRTAQVSADKLDQQRIDLARALRGSDLQSRLTMLRLLRASDAPADDVASLEISAVGLLQAIDFDSLPRTAESRIVLARVADTLVAYRKDFPNSEISSPRFPAVASFIVALKGN